MDVNTFINQVNWWVLVGIEFVIFMVLAVLIWRATSKKH